MSTCWEEKDFTDVTLACEDGKQVEAHKVILATSSPFFKNLLGTIKHPHPLVYMRGVKSEDLVALLDFLYRGEANVFQENLNTFLAIAEELEVKELMGSTDNDLRLMRKSDFEVAPTEEINTKPFFKGQPPEMKIAMTHKPKRKD